MNCSIILGGGWSRWAGVYRPWANQRLYITTFKRWGVEVQLYSASFISKKSEPIRNNWLLHSFISRKNRQRKKDFVLSRRKLFKCLASRTCMRRSQSANSSLTAGSRLNVVPRYSRCQSVFTLPVSYLLEISKNLSNNFRHAGGVQNLSKRSMDSKIYRVWELPFHAQIFLGREVYVWNIERSFTYPS